MELKTNKAVFLDRDGVINKEIGNYITRPEEFQLVPGIGKSLKKLMDKGYLLIVITNQAGIAKGLYSHETLHEIHQRMEKELSPDGVKLTAIYYCPHHPDFDGPCLCRKPGSLMLEQAIEKFHIDVDQSFFIGDRDRDIEAGNKVGVTGFKIESNAGIEAVLKSIL